MPVQSIISKTIADLFYHENDSTHSLWLAKHKTADETRLHLMKMFDLAIYNKYYEGKNPAIWKGNLEFLLPKSSDVHVVQNRPSLNFREIPELIFKLRAFRYRKSGFAVDDNDRPLTTYALEFLVLTGVRTGEVLKARRREFDFRG